uniref:Small serum protein-1 n=1 Tax=Protobothrops flavoviridis TaxID=88087 RepID=L0N0Z0_PROFL|nr:PfSSP-1 precursor [Protobothrops flavoviridis]BAM72534.1 small serum protein-1 [Protobothrops flavoviridis]
MRVFFSLIIFSFTLATCHGVCAPRPEHIDGEVATRICVDPNDRSRHLVVSKWNTAGCTICECFKGGLRCCLRHDAIPFRDGCESVLNQVTCEYEFYRLDDLSKRCDA